MEKIETNHKMDKVENWYKIDNWDQMGQKLKIGEKIEKVDKWCSKEKNRSVEAPACNAHA